MKMNEIDFTVVPIKRIIFSTKGQVTKMEWLEILLSLQSVGGRRVCLRLLFKIIFAQYCSCLSFKMEVESYQEGPRTLDVCVF